MAAGRATRGVVLGGFMGTGKTTVGRALAARLALPFVDLDDELERRHGPIPVQIATGENGFRAREAALIEELCDGVPRVIATGGGAWVDPANRARLAASYRTVVLTAPLDVLGERVRSGGGEAGRPLWDDRIEARLLQRQPAYADAEVHVDVGRRDVDAAVDAILEALRDPGSRRREVTVELGARSYPVIVASGGFSGLGARLAQAVARDRVVVVTDSVVGPLWLPALLAELARAGFSARHLAIPAGEDHKTLETWASLVDRILRLGVDRRTPLVALGGGVLGDITGFAAATTLRGMPLVQIPTTLLSMVDSSVGGKTAVNHSSGKNLIGAFHQPSLVFAALHTLTTLPAEERIAGLGEVVKTALLGDAALFRRLEEDADALRRGEPDALAPVVARCVEIKAEVVAADERESGWRAVLNAGHTVAHGLETALGHGRLRHGEAVAIGLVMEARWAVAAGVCEEPELPDRIAALHARLGLPAVPPPADRRRVLKAMGLDKKAAGDKLVLPVPRLAGEMSLVDLPIASLGELFPEPR